MKTPRIVKNRYFDALLKLVLLSGIVHMSVLFAYVIASGEVELLNYFGILDFSLFFPGIIDGVRGNLAAFFILLGAYFSVFLFLTNRRR